MKQIEQRVAELSATLKPIKQYPMCSQLTSEMVMIAEDSNSYNASYYCNGWVKPCFEGDFKGTLLQSVGEYQVLRMFYVSTMLEGLAYDEIPEDWDEDNAPGFPEMELTDVVEYKQVWMSQNETHVINILDIETEYNNETFVLVLDSLQCWCYEPKYRDYISEQINEYEDTEMLSLEFVFSPCCELLLKKAPKLLTYVIDNSRWTEATKLYRTFRVASRHNFSFPTEEHECAMYLDYLILLSKTGKQMSMTNPKYICPANIRQAHDHLMSKRDKILAEEEKRKALLKEEEFALEHSYLFNIQFDTEHFHFSSLDSVEAYRVEGEIMHHCIYRCAYYDKHDVLSMHITDHEGNRVATCSINVNTQKVMELQTLCNDHEWRQGEEYKEIYNILCARMHTFPRRQKNNNKQLKIA